MRCLPPVDFSFGVNPTQAPKWRPDSNWAAGSDRTHARDGSQTLADRIGLVRGVQPGVEFCNAGTDIVNLASKQNECLPGGERNVSLLLNGREHHFNFRGTLGGNDPELCGVAATMPTRIISAMDGSFQ